MLETEKISLELENIHRKVRIHTKPTWIQEELAKTRAAKKKIESPHPKKVATFQKAKPSEEVAPPIIQEPEPPKEEITEQQPLPEQTQDLKQTKTQNRAYDKTLYHCHKTKNTFHSVFPAYGLLGKEDAYATEQKDMSKDLSNAEPVDWRHHMKTDAVKRYTEEMLKAANMRGKKK